MAVLACMVSNIQSVELLTETLTILTTDPSWDGDEALLASTYQTLALTAYFGQVAGLEIDLTICGLFAQLIGRWSSFCCRKLCFKN